MTPRENKIRAYRRQKPEWIPITVGITHMCWNYNDPTELEALILAHPILFPNQEPLKTRNHPLPVFQQAGKSYVDGWGCTWVSAHDGMLGTVHGHPVADWSALDSLKAPDPDRSDGMRVEDAATDWEKMRSNIQKSKDNGHFTGAGIEHGHTLLRLEYLRGYQNLVFDMADEDPRLDRMIGLVKGFSLERVRRLVGTEPDMILYPEDLGSQTQSLISPDLFRKYIKPVYRELVAPAREKGILVHMHSDGYILELLEDLMDVGMDVMNMQDLVNGLDNIRRCVDGRIAVDLDIDRQGLTVSGSPKDIDDHIREAVMKLGSPEGGLSMTWQVWPPTPIRNMAAVMEAMEKYSLYYR
ncbi:MAG TPA: hypothetical protein DD727_08490 [Clostridiales bacterium]|nr:hypothetical protein [Clostridiales bacterium]